MEYILENILLKKFFFAFISFLLTKMREINLLKYPDTTMTKENIKTLRQKRKIIFPNAKEASVRRVQPRH